MTDLKSILKERKESHGDYTLTAAYAQALKEKVREMYNWDTLDCCQRESIEMILHKIARIMSGDPCLEDHWDDIKGYAEIAK